MVAISTTNERALGRLIVAKILAMTPRMTVQGAEGWKHYERSTDAATRTRRFTLKWGFGRHFTGGIMTSRVQEMQTTLSVRTDYAGDHARMTELIQNDWAQLRDVIGQLSTDTTSGLILCLQATSVPSIVSDNDHGRSRVNAQGPASSDVAQWNLPFSIRYLQARAQAA